MAPSPAAALTLSSWVEQQSKPMGRAGAALTGDVIDALEALRDTGLNTTTRGRLVAIVERADRVGVGVPVAAAAELLGVSDQTIRTWVARGVLDVVGDVRPTQIRPRSLAEVADAVNLIRAGSEDARRVLRNLLDIQEIAGLDGREHELADRLPLDPDRVAEQLYS